MIWAASQAYLADDWAGDIDLGSKDKDEIVLK
jgi:hypothetical protein